MAFSGCFSLGRITLDSLKEIGTDCFNSCDSLQILHAPLLQRINKDNFQTCKALLYLDFPQLKHLKYSFTDAKNVQFARFPLCKCTFEYQITVTADSHKKNLKNNLVVAELPPKSLFKSYSRPECSSKLA